MSPDPNKISPDPNTFFRFWQELKRRKVVRVITVYAAAAFVILELVSIIVDPLKLPEWTLPLVIVLLCIGLVIAVILSWVYEVTPEGIEKTVPAGTTKTVQTGGKEKKPSASRGWKIASYVSFGLIVFLILLNVIPRTQGTEEIELPDKSIAVLPFENMSDGSEFDHLGDALTDELIMYLFKINSFEVRSRTSVLQYKNTGKSSPVIGRELKVNYLLEGSTQRYEDRVRIRVQLIEASTDDHIWGEIFEGEWNEIFDIQINVAKQVAAELKAVLSPEEIETIEKTPTENSEAYDLYLKGRWFWNKWTDEDIRKGMEYFRQAIETDPDYALAYAGQAEAYNTLSWYGQMVPADAYPRARELAIKALEIDPELAEAHIALAFVKVYYDWNWEGGEESFRRAIELEPENVTAHHLFAYYLALQTRYEEAFKEINRALSLDPLNLITNRTLGDFYYHMRDYDRAEAQLIRTLEMDRAFTFTHAYLGLVYLQKGMCDRALEELQNEIEFAVGTEDLALAWMGYAYGLCGDWQKGMEVLDTLMERSRSRYIPPSYFTWTCFALGEHEKGWEWLNEAFKERDPWLTEIKHNHFYDGIRTDPRYTDLLNRMDLE